MTPTDNTIYTTATPGERFLMGFEPFLGALLMGVILYYFQPYCTEYLNMPAALPGIIFAAGMIFSALLDPIFGVIVDKYPLSKHFRYTPWFVGGVIILCLGSVGGFWNPGFHNVTITVAYMLVMLLIIVMGNSLRSVSVGPLRNIITTDPGQRSTLALFAAPAILVAALLVANIPRITDLFTEYVGKAHSFRYLVLLFSALSVVAAFLVAKAVIRKDKIAAAERIEQTTVRDMFGALKTNRPLQMLILADGANMFAASMMSSAAVYFYKYVAGDGQLRTLSLVATVGVFTGLLGAVLAALAAKRYGRKRAYIIGTWTSIAMNVLMLILRPFSFDAPILPGLPDAINKQIFLFLPIMSLGYVFGSVVENNKWVMIADCVDYGNWKSGKFAPATYNSVFSLLSKLCIALAGIAIGVILGAVGFVDNGIFPQPPVIVMALMSIMLVAPLVGHILSLFAMKYYEIDMDLYKRMMSEMAEKRKHQAQADVDTSCG